MKLFWKISLLLFSFALVACSEELPPAEQPEEGGSAIVFSPERLELSAPIGGSTDGFFTLSNGGDERLSYTSDVFFTPDLEITLGEQGALAPGESVNVAFQATCTELRLDEDENGFFIPIAIGVATSGREYFPFISTLPLTLRCV